MQRIRTQGRLARGTLVMSAIGAAGLTPARRLLVYDPTLGSGDTQAMQYARLSSDDSAALTGARLNVVVVAIIGAST
jgi:hypothetical protein